MLLAVLFAVQVGLAILGSSTEKDAVGDVLNVYQPWAEALHPAGKWLGLGQPWVYPFLAWLPILATKAIWFVDYLNAWMCLAGALNIVAVGQLVRWGRRRSAFAAAWYFVAFLALLGPVAITRLDGISVSLALLAIASIATVTVEGAGASSKVEALNTNRAMVWLMVATWVKVWPAALILALLQKGRLLRGQLKYLGISLGVILAVSVLLAANQNLFSFVTFQSSRGLQIESPIATIWLWLAHFGVGSSLVYFDLELVTYQVAGVMAPQIAALMTSAMLLAIGITAWLFWKGRQAAANPRHLAALTALTATLDLIVFNKVGSPQYQLWLVAAVVMGLVFGVPRWAVPTVVTLVLAGLTQAIYPLFYDQLVALQLGPLTLLTLRNIGLIYLLVWANFRLGALSKAPKNG